jgi:hypothetical protein
MAFSEADGGCEQIVGNPSFTRLGKSCPSFGILEARDVSPRCL